jgi:endonuclease/exonuclease/phosphatase family metal-dependent hydrolase
MKSGCFDKALDQASIAKMPNTNEKEAYAKTACGELAKQAKPLEAWVDARAKEGVPFILLGDFNRRFVRDIALEHNEIQGLWQAIDDEGPEALWAPTIKAESKCWGGYYKDYIDHIVFDPKAKAIYVENSFDQLVFEQKYTREISQNLSDHCPISVQLAL